MMATITIVVAFAIVSLLSWLLTGRLRRYALRRNVMDVPNARSSHTVPTPRGGGVAIVVTALAGLCLMVGTGLLAPGPGVAIGGAGALVAVIGFIDDHAHIAARWRLATHFAAAIWGLAWLNHGADLTRLLPGLPLAVILPLSAIFLVWLLNLYNFMDGIDGIASVEAVSVALAGAALHWMAGAGSGALMPLLLVAAVVGFLIWNFPPARIFMGDAGSGFLGMMLGLMTLMAGLVAPPLVWAWLILLGVFVADATTTLTRRALRGERVWEAHRSHAYQRASRLLRRHLPVTLATLLINVCWLTPLAFAVGLQVLPPMVGLAVAYMPLVWLSLRLGAGLPDDVPVRW